MFAQGDIGTNLETRRPDADTTADRYRRYEIAGAPHVSPWELLSFASDADMQRATRGQPAAVDDDCRPRDVTPSDFPTRYAFNAAWRNLDRWVREGVAPPRATPLELKPASAGAFDPAAAFVEDAHGNARGGVRTPAVDVPTARWVGARSGPFRCMFDGYKFPFGAAKLESLYGGHAGYVREVRESAEKLRRAGWLTPTDTAEIVREAEAARLP